MGIGRTFQNIRLFQDMTSLENVLVGMHARLRGGIVGRLTEHRTNFTWAIEGGYVSFGKPGHRFTRGGLPGDIRTKGDAWFGAVRASTRLR